MNTITATFMPGPGVEANRDETDPIDYDLMPPPYGGHNGGYYGLLITTSPAGVPGNGTYRSIDTSTCPSQ